MRIAILFLFAFISAVLAQEYTTINPLHQQYPAPIIQRQVPVGISEVDVTPYTTVSPYTVSPFPRGLGVESIRSRFNPFLERSINPEVLKNINPELLAAVIGVNPEKQQQWNPVEFNRVVSHLHKLQQLQALQDQIQQMKEIQEWKELKELQQMKEMGFPQQALLRPFTGVDPREQALLRSFTGIDPREQAAFLREQALLRGFTPINPREQLLAQYPMQEMVSEVEMPSAIMQQPVVSSPSLIRQTIRRSLPRAALAAMGVSEKEMIEPDTFMTAAPVEEETDSFETSQWRGRGGWGRGGFGGWGRGGFGRWGGYGGFGGWGYPGYGYGGYGGWGYPYGGYGGWGYGW